VLRCSLEFAPADGGAKLLDYTQRLAQPDRHQPQRHLIRTRLDNFYQQAAATGAAEAHRPAATIEECWPAIEAGILTGYTNAFKRNASAMTPGLRTWCL
jgi:hypothetical protein